MSLIGLVAFVVLFGVALYLIETFIPMPPYLKIVIRVLVVLLIVVFILRLAGFAMPGFRFY